MVLLMFSWAFMCFLWFRMFPEEIEHNHRPIAVSEWRVPGLQMKSDTTITHPVSTQQSLITAWVGAWRPNLSLFTVILLLWLISGQAREAHFDAAVISLLWLISGQAWEVHFDAIYGDPALGADLRTTLGDTF